MIDTTAAMDYTIALQRSIEYHCKGKIVPDEIARVCPHHAEMLNKHLVAAQQSVQRTAIACAILGAFVGWIICRLVFGG